jgi:broad specificity phosphatase PhoE
MMKHSSRNPFVRPVVFACAAIVLASGVAAAQASTVILVRHAEKAARPADDPPLTNDGQARAKDLAAAVADAHVSTVIATQFIRTQATAKPVADAAGKTTIVVPATADPKAHADSVAAKVRAAPAGSAVLVVGHSNTIPLIIAALGGPKIPDLCDGEYANMFVMQMAGSGAPRLVRAKYGISDPMGSEKCTRPMKK